MKRRGLEKEFCESEIAPLFVAFVCSLSVHTTFTYVNSLKLPGSCLTNNISTLERQNYLRSAVIGLNPDKISILFLVLLWLLFLLLQ